MQLIFDFSKVYKHQPSISAREPRLVPLRTTIIWHELQSLEEKLLVQPFTKQKKAQKISTSINTYIYIYDIYIHQFVGSADSSFGHLLYLSVLSLPPSFLYPVIRLWYWTHWTSQQFFRLRCLSCSISLSFCRLFFVEAFLFCVLQDDCVILNSVTQTKLIWISFGSIVLCFFSQGRERIPIWVGN